MPEEVAMSIKRASIAIFWMMLAGTLLFAQEQRQFHPTFPLLDGDGQNVLYSGKPVSTMTTCQTCHDTRFIEKHSQHSWLGMQDLAAMDSSAIRGPYGRWNPVDFRYFDRDKLDLSLTEWRTVFGSKHAGGGAAAREPFDKAALQTVEMNCFLCHLPNPDNQARLKALRSDAPAWANTATLAQTGIVENKGGWQWQRDAFDGAGNLKQAYSQMSTPSDANCALCHDHVHRNPLEPFTLGQPTGVNVSKTGEVFSSQRIFDSGLNIAGKDTLARAWDVHAERLVACVDCHFSTNHPNYYAESDATRPDHLKFDPRRMSLRNYLEKPSHQLAAGPHENSSGAVVSCQSCHQADQSHDWLPYKDRHFAVMSCESCHIPRQLTPAIREVDWTLITPAGGPRVDYRGIDGAPGDPTKLITGFRPVLLPRMDEDGLSRLRPYNLITGWFWVMGPDEKPVPLAVLKAAFLNGNGYRRDVMERLDQDKDGRLEDGERARADQETIRFLQDLLAGQGVENPRLKGEVHPYAINHGVSNYRWVISECTTCHSDNSILYQPVNLSGKGPGASAPAFADNIAPVVEGAILSGQGGGFNFKPAPRAHGLFVLGHDTLSWLNIAGIALFLMTLLGIALHGGLRVIASRKHGHQEQPVKKVYMYHTYERFWHWLQALAIMLLIFTGIIIHAPQHYGWLDYAFTVHMHNILGFILLANAFFSAFYHFAGGEIRQYLPEPRGFFSQAISQTLYYLQGIFKDAPHPFEKEPGKKLNPLQRVIYLIILNILLPVQIVTGVLIWGAQTWPQISNALGGLTVLVPIHSFAAWLFAAFLIMHIYLTTTGHTPMANIKAMITGWDELPATEDHKESKA